MASEFSEVGTAIALCSNPVIKERARVALAQIRVEMDRLLRCEERAPVANVSHSKTSRAVCDDFSLLEVARKAIEDRLIERRDARIFYLGRGNGLVVREKDGTPSDLIRMGPEEAIVIGLNAIADYLDGSKAELPK